MLALGAWRRAVRAALSEDKWRIRITKSKDVQNQLLGAAKANLRVTDVPGIYSDIAADYW